MPRTIKRSHKLVCSQGMGRHGPYTFCTGTAALKREDHRTGLAKHGKTKKVKSSRRSPSHSRTPEEAMPYSPGPAPRRTLRQRPRVDYKKMRKDPRTGKIVYSQ